MCFTTEEAEVRENCAISELQRYIRSKLCFATEEAEVGKKFHQGGGKFSSVYG